MWEILKSDQQRHKEAVDIIRLSQEKRRDAFISNAKLAGFSEVQIKVMVNYLSLSGHVHQYHVDVHDRITLRDE